MKVIVTVEDRIRKSMALLSVQEIFLNVCIIIILCFLSNREAMNESVMLTLSVCTVVTRHPSHFYVYHTL